ncbi:MAG: hypothetical protein ACXVA2_18680 [Mucilaginibacter sp.]
MKKICLLLILCISFAQLKAQDGVVFKIKYLPNHNYQMSVKMGMKITGTVSGDTAIINKLKAEGITQPVSLNMDLGAGGTIKTGAMETGNTFPMNLDFSFNNLDIDIDGKQIPMPAKVTETKVKMSAHVSQDVRIMIDSVMGKKVDDNSQKDMHQMMDMVQKQIKFPDKAMKPGDTFTQSMPLNLPVKGTGANMQMTAGVTYKLVSISDGKAYFDLVPNLDMNMTVKGFTLNMSGTGGGKLVYSIKDNFPISKEVTFDMKIKVTSSKFNVDGRASVTSSVTTSIN